MTVAVAQIPQEDQMRADLYGLMSALLAGPPSAALLAQAAGLRGDDTELGRAIAALAKLAGKMAPATIEREYLALFIGVGRGELLPFASYYMTGFLNEKPLARLRQDMARLGMARDPGVFEPEDSAASLMEIMGATISGRFGAPRSLAQQRDFFNTHIAPWAGHFFTDLQGAKNSVFYQPVGAIGQHFMTIETEGFRMIGG